jgi:hypothetical protein
VLARQRGKQLAGAATRAVGRARKAATQAAAIQSGETPPVPRASVPASVIRRLSLGKDVGGSNGKDSNGHAHANGRDKKRRKSDDVTDRPTAVVDDDAEDADADQGSDEPHRDKRGRIRKYGRGGKNGTRNGKSGGGDKKDEKDASEPKPPPAKPAKPARPPRPVMDLKNDPKAAARAEMWRSTVVGLYSC